MQRVVVHFVQCDVVPHVTPRPVHQWVELGDGHAVGDIGFLCRNLGTCLRLLAAQTGDPCFLPMQSTAQGLKLANTAAGFAVGHALENSLLAWAFHKGNDCLMLGFIDLNTCAGVGLQAFQQCQGFAVQRTGFQHENGNIQRQLVDEMGDDHVFGAQARSLFQRLQLGRSSLKLCLRGGQFVSEVGAGFGV